MAIITQEQYNIVKQRHRRVVVKIDLLNFNFQVVGSLEGNVITGGININANSDIRRSCNITIVVKNHTFKIDVGGQIWLDKYIKIYYGIINNSTQETIWTNMGIYLINNPNHIYDAVNNTISFAGIDLMAKISGLRNGYFDWLYEFGLIEKGANIRKFFYDSLEWAGFTGRNIEELLIWNDDIGAYSEELPIDFEISSVNSLYDIYNNIRNDFFPNYEMFFDLNGIFNFKRIYNKASDPIVINNDIFDKTVLSMSNDIDFENVKNAIQLWGQTLEPEYGNPICTTGSGESFYVKGYSCEINSLEEFTSIPDETYIIIKVSNINSTNNPYLKINKFSPHPIIKDNNFFIFSPNYYYTVRYDSDIMFDSQIGVFETVLRDTNIYNCAPFIISGTRTIYGYYIKTEHQIDSDIVNIFVDKAFSYEKPYFRINNETPHPIIKNNKFFMFSNSKYYTLKYNAEKSFDFQTGVFEVVSEQNDIPNCNANYSELYYSEPYSCIINSLIDFQNIPADSYIGFGIKNISLKINPYLKINDYTSHPIVRKKDNQYSFYSFDKKYKDVDYYIVIYEPDVEFDNQTGVFRMIGLQQVYYYIEDDNPQSPFYVQGSIGKILLPLSGGEYDNIQTMDQAKDRAELELYNHARMNDKIRLTSTIIPWADVNQKIEYINEDAELSGIFIIKSISIDLSIEGTMTLECIRWYDDDPWSDN